MESVRRVAVADLLMTLKSLSAYFERSREVSLWNVTKCLNNVYDDDGEICWALFERRIINHSRISLRRKKIDSSFKQKIGFVLGNNSRKQKFTSHKIYCVWKKAHLCVKEELLKFPQNDPPSGKQFISLHSTNRIELWFIKT
jgi:hypothetical protein